MRTIEQKKFEFVIDTLEELLKGKKEDKKFLKEFSSFVSGAPVMILQNGLIQSIAFWEAKKENDKFKIILKLLEKIVFENSLDLDYLINLSQENYIEVTDKVLKTLEWAKRFAQMIKPDKESNDEK